MIFNPYLFIHYQLYEEITIIKLCNIKQSVYSKPAALTQNRIYLPMNLIHGNTLSRLEVLREAITSYEKATGVLFVTYASKNE